MTESGDARFAQALALGTKSIAAVPDAKTVERWDTVYLAQNTATISHLVGRKVDGVGAVLDKLYPAGTEGNGILDFQMLVACLQAPHDVAKRCTNRLREVSNGRIGFIDGLLEGAEAYIEGDFRGASKAWRPMIARQGWQLDDMRDRIADAFERAGEMDLLERVDAPLLAQPGRYNGADLVHARAARRLAKAGKTAEAKRYAQMVIDAWSVADLEVPAVAEMRKLVARLKPPVP
jgi:hypothetical protein